MNVPSVSKNSLAWQRWLITGLVLLLAPAVGFLATPDFVLPILLATLALTVGSVLVYFLYRQPGLGLVLIVPVSMVVPFSIGTGTQTGIHGTILLLVLLLGLWLYEMWGRSSLQLYKSATIPPLLLLLVVTALAFVVGQLPWLPVSHAPLVAQLGGLAVFLFSAGMFLLAVHQYRQLRWLEWTVWALVGLGTVYVGFRVVPGAFRYSGYIFTFGGTSSQFWTWFVALIFGQALLNRQLGWKGRLLLWVILAVTLYSILFQTGDWKSGWIPPLVAILSIVVLRWLPLNLPLGAAAIIVVPLLVAGLIASDEYSFSTRVDAWLVLLEIIRLNPILGLGPANYYFYTPLFGIRGYSVQFNSHSQYIDMILQTGVLGLACLLWFFVAVGLSGWRLRERVGDGFAYAYVYAALGGLVATFVAGFLGDWFIPFVYNVGLVGVRSSIMGWLFLGGLVAIERMLANGEPVYH